MKKYLTHYFVFIFLVYYSNVCCAQNDRHRYVILDDIEEDCVIKKYTLNTQELYGVDETIEMYNFMIMNSYTILISVFPDFYSDSNWTEIDVDAIKNKITSKDNSWNRFCSQTLASEDVSDKKDWGFKLVKKHQDKWYASNVTLFELFVLRNWPHHFSPPFWYLNMGQEPITMRTTKDSIFQRKPFLNNIAFPLYGSSGYYTGFPSELKKHYLTAKFEMENETFYKFWSLNHWNIVDGYNVHRGIDRLVYSNELGVVAGSFDFYFVNSSFSFDHRKRRNANNKTVQELMENALNEKVMWAEELKHLKPSGM